MRGVTGRLGLGGVADDIARAMPVILLGTLTYLGADIAFGCGRYRIELPGGDFGTSNTTVTV
jgi:hypothetical protein